MIVDIRQDTPMVGVNVLELSVSGQGVTPGDIGTWVAAGSGCDDLTREKIIARAVVSEDLTLRMPVFTALDGPVILCYQFDRERAVRVDGAGLTKVREGLGVIQSLLLTARNVVAATHPQVRPATKEAPPAADMGAMLAGVLPPSRAYYLDQVSVEKEDVVAHSLLTL